MTVKGKIVDIEMAYQPSTKMQWCQACLHFHPYYYKCRTEAK